MPHLTEAPLRLSNANLAQFSQAETRPDYDRTQLKHGIVHVGVGGFHRAHLAVYVDRLLSKFAANDWSICGVGLTAFDASMRDALDPQDHLYTVIERSARGSSAHIIGSISEYIFAPGNEEAVIAKMADKDTHIVSLTITESGYYYNENTHELDVSNPNIQFDLTGDGPPRTTYGYLTAALARRYKAGLRPFTVMSCDNMQKNGSISRNMLLAFARLKEPNMAAWLSENGAFPNSMVDRITPRTVDEDKQGLQQQFGIEDAWPVVTEPFMQWVLEDNFSDGRPQFEDVGVQVVPTVRDVEQFELMKLRLLNGGHVAMGYLASLAGFTYVHEVIADPLFSQYLNDLWYEEVKPLLPSIPGVDVDEYIQTLHSRFSNPTLKDEVARICLGGSGKMPQFILPSIAEQIESRGPIGRLTLCVAAWFRYLSGVDENGKTYKIDDPMAKELQALAREGGASPNVLLGVQTLFGDDLRYDGRFVREITMAMRTLDRRGARKTLEKYVELPEDDKISIAGSTGSITGTHTRESSRTRESRTREDMTKRMQEDEIASLRQQVTELTLEKKRLATKLNDIWKMSSIY